MSNELINAKEKQKVEPIPTLGTYSASDIHDQSNSNEGGDGFCLIGYLT